MPDLKFMATTTPTKIKSGDMTMLARSARAIGCGDTPLNARQVATKKPTKTSGYEPKRMQPRK
jgi:hypothetical protein